MHCNKAAHLRVHNTSHDHTLTYYKAFGQAWGGHIPDVPGQSSSGAETPLLCNPTSSPCTIPKYIHVCAGALPQPCTRQVLGSFLSLTYWWLWETQFPLLPQLRSQHCELILGSAFGSACDCCRCEWSGCVEADKSTGTLFQSLSRQSSAEHV